MLPGVEHLEEFLATYTFDGEGVDTSIDMIFFKVGVSPTVNLMDFVAALDSVPTQNGIEFKWREGGEFSYIHIGAWVGDQRTALVLMAVGTYLGLWKLLTPRTMFGRGLAQKLVNQMAGAGLVAVQSQPQK